MKPRTLCACQSVAFVIPEGGAVGPADQFQHDGLLAALARRGRGVLGGGSLPRPLALRGNVGRLWRNGGAQWLDGLPDPGHGALAVGELLDRLEIAAESGHPREAVPDLDQAVGRPVGGELGKLLFGGEVLLAFGDLLGVREGCDGVVVVDGK